MNSIMRTNFDFFYGKEAEQFSFLRIPKLLFKEERFKKLSSDAKLLYALLLDRMSLSIKNGWLDEENRAYIYFTNKEVMEELNMASEKCTKIFSELDSNKGCGLIIKIRQGLGKPDVIYVMNFLSCVSVDNEASGMQDDVENPVLDCDLSGVSKIENQEIRKSKVRKFENQMSGISEFESQDIRKSKSNKNEINNNQYNNTEFSDINHIPSNQISGTYMENDVKDEMAERERYRVLISKNIEYEFIVQNYSKGLADGILETMLDAICSRSPYIIVSGAEIPQEVVKSRLLKLNNNHIVYVLDCLYKNTTKIHNIKSYLLTALYNSFTTLEHYYVAEVNHDLYGNN